MKLLLVLIVCAVAAAAPKVNKVAPFELDLFKGQDPESRNLVINALVNQFFNHLRRIINGGSSFFGIPPLDPLNLDHFHLVIPAGLINLDLELKNIFVAGIGGFVVNRSNLNVRTQTFDVDISVPAFDIRAGEYDLTGDLFTAVPLYGKGQARFFVEVFRFRGRIYWKQSEDGNSVIIDRIENPSFELPSVKSELTGAIGGGDIDAIVNAMIEEVIIDYANRFHGAIAKLVAHGIPIALNPFLEQLDSWRFIAPVMPRN